MSSLHRALAKSKLATAEKTGEQEDDFPWPVEVWEQARRDLAAGTFKTRGPIRFPIILATDSPVFSAEKLQQLAELPSLPEVIEADRLECYGPEEKVVGRAKFCHVSFEELKRIKNKAELLDGMEHNILVMFNGAPRYARVVKSLKEGIALGGENASRKDQDRVSK
ncbi:hypothetical protein C8A03DRAFT_18580 [Achaetomium macrosporum]|uniref:Uncharacterized protein n=1 Tax=Achaetomium macrosporum TaxID=79813 RepID=A0AAN7C3B5_9PEZI|nr:hypothetical protein C8A03DRAFT_18580 [Achaetomium macrosporum]